MKINSRILLAFAILIIGITVSVVAQIMRNNARANAKANDVNQFVENQTEAIRHEVLSGLSSVEILGYFFEENPHVTRKEFRNYTEPIYRGNNSIKAISWVPKITQNKRLELEIQIQNEQANPGFSITDRNSGNESIKSGNRPYYFPIRYIEPFNQNLNALGYDIFSNPIRRSAILKAVRTKKLTITPRIKLVQDTLGYSFLALVPVFQSATPNTKYGNIENVSGLISAVFKAGQLMNNALSRSKNLGIKLIVFDVTGKQHDEIYRNINAVQSTFRIHKKQLTVAGRVWELNFVVDPILYRVNNKYTYVLIGISTSLLIFLLLMPSRKTKKNKQLSQKLDLEQKVREQTEQSLSESEAYNRVLFEQVSIGLVLTSMTGKLTDVNSAYAQMLGMTRDEVLTHTFMDVTLDKYIDQDKEIIKNLMIAGHYGPYEKEYVHKDGHLIPVRLQGKLIELSGVKYILSSVENITERKQKELSLHKWAAIFENADWGVVSTSQDLKSLDLMNPAFARMHGYSVDELVGKPIVELFTPEYRDQFNRQVKMAHENGSHSFESMHIRKDGTVFPVQINIAVVKDDKGEILFRAVNVLDITERKQVEETLRYHEELLKEMGRVAKIGGWEFDVATGKGTWTEEVARIHDFDNNDETNIMLGLSFYHDESREKIEKAIKDAVELGKSYNLELEMISAKGVHKWVHTIGHPTIVDGCVVHVRGSFQDITERKLATLELIKTEAFMTTAVENLPLIFYLIDTDGKFQISIGAGLKSLGLNQNQVVNLSTFELYKDYPNIVGAVKKSLGGESTYFESTIGGASFDNFLIPVFDSSGVLVSVAGVAMEITERKNFEEEILKLNGRLHNLIVVIQRLAQARSQEEIMHSVRTAVRKLTNADGATFVLRDVDQCYYADEDAISPLWKGQRFSMDICISGWAMLNKEVVVVEDIYKDNRIPHAAYRPTFVKSLAIVPIRTAEPVGAIGVYWARNYRPTDDEIVLVQTLADATAIALENVQFVGELETKVKERTVQLEAANKELEAFSYSVSHDLRAPLRHISGYIDLLKRRYPDSLPERGQQFLNNISESSIQMGLLIDDLLQFSRTSRQEIRYDKLNMYSIVKESITIIQHDNGGRKIEWAIAPLPVVWGDNNLLKLVWINLLSNAAKFTRKKEKARIEIEYREDETEYTFSVQDNGAGFDMQYSQKLFGVFQRLHSIAEYEGTGIGLANVQRIIARHGGRTWAEAELEKGAKFYFTLPKNKNKS